MIRIREAIVVEGRYDRARLQAVVEALIVETEGFGIFRDREKLTLLGRLAETQGLIVLTDSDAAGFMIRDRLAGAIPPPQIKHAYIPEIRGKEGGNPPRRKKGCWVWKGWMDRSCSQRCAGPGRQSRGGLECCAAFPDQSTPV